MLDCDLVPLTTMIDYFSCTPFISERRFFNNAVISIADDITVAFNDVTTLSDVNVKDRVLDVHYNQCI